MENRYLKIAAACVASLGLASVTPALAQGTGGGSTAATNGASGNGQTQDEGGGNWGWIGLIGLLGLMGMRRKHDDTGYGTTRRDNMGRA